MLFRVSGIQNGNKSIQIVNSENNYLRSQAPAWERRMKTLHPYLTIRNSQKFFPFMCGRNL